MSEELRKTFTSWVYQNHGCELQEFYRDKPAGTMKRWPFLNDCFLIDTTGPGDWDCYTCSIPPVLPR